MDYIPHTEEDLKTMLQTIGVKKIDDLFSHLPDELLEKDTITLEKGLSELEVSQKLKNLTRKNISLSEYPGFLGAGLYDHYIPPAVDTIVNRSEYYTAYTPYQPEASQGLLQSIIEYQTVISRLSKMDISNASLYDGSSALAEAVLMAVEITGKNEAILSKTIHPEWVEVVKTYLSGKDITIKMLDHQEGETDFDRLKSYITPDTACLCLQSPNFFGVIEDYRDIKKELLDSSAKKPPLLIVGTYPFSLGLLEAPGSWGADIVVGDGQSLGNYIGFGGPHFGFIACKQEYIRKLPGRIVGETVDGLNNRGFCLTFQTREQHIRREKATSNICSNQALMALRAVIYLSLLGDEGLKEAASLAYQKAHYLQKQISKLPAFQIQFQKPFFNEFVIRSRVAAGPINQALFNEGLIGGLALDKFDSQYENLILLAVTEKRTKSEMDTFVKVLKKFN